MFSELHNHILTIKKSDELYAEFFGIYQQLCDLGLIAHSPPRTHIDHDSIQIHIQTQAFCFLKDNALVTSAYVASHRLNASHHGLFLGISQTYANAIAKCG